MPNLLGRSLLCLSSYFPMLLIAAILVCTKHIWIAVVCLLLGLVGVLGVLIYIHNAQRIAPKTITVAGHQRRDSDIVSYFVTYLLTFLAVPMEGWERIIAFFVFFALLGFIYVNSNLLHVNPMLNILGYRIYELVVDGEASQILICHHRIAKGEKIRVIEVDEDIFLEKYDGKAKTGKRPAEGAGVAPGVQSP